jgi:cytochrome P450
MVEAVDDALAAWERPAAEGTPFDLGNASNQLAMKVVTRALFGTGPSARETDEVSEALVSTLDYLVRGVVQSALPSWAPAPGRRRHEASVRVIDRVAYRMIADCRAGRGRGTLLSLLVDAADDAGGTGMTDQQLRDEVTTLFLGGYDTTALMLTWAWAYLTRRPDLERRLYDEVDAVLAGRAPTFDDLPRLDVTRRVLQEAMRLRPPAWQLTRTAAADDVIDGYSIPAGAHLLVFIYGVHHHPEVWPDPERFDPDRFAPPAVEKRHRYAWVPFGAGQRLCIARDFALMEGQIALAMIAQRYRLRALDRAVPAPVLSTTLRPQSKVTVGLTRRS